MEHKILKNNYANSFNGQNYNANQVYWNSMLFLVPWWKKKLLSFDFIIKKFTNLRRRNNKITNPEDIRCHPLLTLTQTTACSVHLHVLLPPHGPTSKWFHFQTKKEKKKLNWASIWRWNTLQIGIRRIYLCSYIRYLETNGNLQNCCYKYVFKLSVLMAWHLFHVINSNKISGEFLG